MTTQNRQHFGNQTKLPRVACFAMQIFLSLREDIIAGIVETLFVVTVLNMR